MNPTCTRRIADETLHRLFDGDLTDAALAEHVEACPSCSQRLRRLREQHQLLSTLFSRDGKDEDLSARLGSVLGQHARASLADLVFELAESCLARARRRLKLPTPRAPEHLLPEINSVAARLDGLGEGVDVADLRSEARAVAGAPDDDLADLLAACVRLLAALEGASERVEALTKESADEP